MRGALLLGTALILVAGSAASAQDGDNFIGEWGLETLASSPWSTGGHVFSVSATSASDVRDFAARIGGTGERQLRGRCLGDGEGALPASSVFYSANYTWSGGGTVKGCATERGRELWGPGRVEFAESTRPATETSMSGYWSDDTAQPGFGWGFAAERLNADDPCKGARAVAHSAAVNEVRVVAVAQEVAWHKSGAPENEWNAVCKDTVLQQGDEISCDPDGAVTLQFADNSTVVVKNTTQLKIGSFFTEGGVVRTEILLKMGEIAAKVKKSEATKSDFHIRTPNLDGGSVRGTDFSVFYDPGSRTSLWSVREGTVDVNNSKGKHKLVTAGREAFLAGSSFTVAKLGKAGARGGLNLRAALAKVIKVVAKADRCGATTPRLGAFAVKPRRKGWTVTVKVVGKLKGTSKWSVVSGRVKPANGLARKLRRGCS